MTATVLQLLLAPLLVAAATLAGRRWGDGTAGIVSAFPAIVGPVLLLDAHAHGSAFAADAAAGTLVGLVALAGFVVAYARAAARVRWPGALGVAWLAAALLAAAVGSGSDVALPVAVAAATASLALALRALPDAPARAAPVRLPGWELPARMALVVALVAGLAAAASELGALAGGVLAALPVLASVLAVATHRRHGAPAVAALLRGMVLGMGGFVVFCAAFALLVGPAGAAGAFLAAGAGAVAAQALAHGRRSPSPPGGVTRSHGRT